MKLSANNRVLCGMRMCAVLYCCVLMGAFGQQPTQQASMVYPGAQLEPVDTSGFEFELTEGPTCDAHGNVFFSDQANDQILRWDAQNGEVTELLNPSGFSKGLSFDNFGVILAGANLNNELWAISPYSGKHTAIFKGDEGYHGTHFLGPNKIWVSPTGWVYFTDAGAELLGQDRLSWSKQVHNPRVYRFHPESNELVVAVDGPFSVLDGIVGSPDGKVLYLSDSQQPGGLDGITYEYDILDDGSLANRKMFVERGSLGMTVDQQGNVYMTTSGVTVYSSSGVQLEHIDVPEVTTDIAFAGADFKTLFITCVGALYTLDMQVTGGCELCKHGIDTAGKSMAL